MHIKFYSIKLFLIALLLSMGMANRANAQFLQVDMDPPFNVTKGGLNLPASAGDILQYVIRATNTYTENFVASTLYINIPEGTSYVTGSTSLNGYSIPDVNGKMPFVGSGGYVNSISNGNGIISPGTFAKVIYQVKVLASAGKISNQAIADVSIGQVTYKNFYSSTVVTQLVPDPACSTVYQSTALTESGTGPFSNIRTMYTEYGKGGATIYNGVGGPCYDAITGAALPAGSIMTNVAALAYDRNSNRIYFVNNAVSPAQDLCYVDLSASPVSAKRFVGYPLETITSAGYNINRMTFAADGYGYAVTSNSLDLIRFSIDASTGLPVISRLGALSNAVINGSNDILAEAGGDIFSDGSGKLYMVVNSGKFYRIDPATRIATYLGTINPVPSGATSSVAIDTAGNIYLGGAYQNVYRVDLNTLRGGSITKGNTVNVWTTGDYAGCAFPMLQPDIQVNRSYRKTSGYGDVVSGDTIEFTNEVVNTGNINATGVKVYDSIPAYSRYVASSTTINGTTVADAAATMPFAASGGRFINSPGELAGIIKPGDANKVVIKFRIVVTEPLQGICDDAIVTLIDANGYTLTISTHPGSLDGSCFWVYNARTPGARIATTGNTQPSAKTTVQPNPFISTLNLQLQVNTAAAVQIRLFDLYGRTVFTTSQKLATGFHSLHINVPAGLTPGIYVLEVTDGNNRLLQKKLLKQ